MSKEIETVEGCSASPLHDGMDAEIGTEARECASSPSSQLPFPKPSGAHSGVKKRGVFDRARGAVALAVVAFVLVGLIFHLGVGTPSALGFGSVAAICPLGALEALFGAKEFMLHPIILLTVVLVAVVLVGKAFCSWMCPVPWLRKFFSPSKKDDKGIAAGNGETEGSRGQNIRGRDDGSAAEKGATLNAEAETRIAQEAKQLAASVREGAQQPSATHGCTTCGSACALAAVGGKRDGVQIDSRHAVLAGTLASAAVFGFPVFCLVCPVGLTFATLIGVWNLFRFNEPSWALVVFPAILIFEVVFLKKWCAKICPISALVSLVSNTNVTLKPKVDKSRCLREKGVDCHACVDACPEQLDPHTRRIPECSKCGKCVEACPAHAIGIKLLAGKK